MCNERGYLNRKHLPIIFPGKFGLLLLERSCVCWQHLLCVDLHHPQEILVHNRRGLLFGASQCHVERVQEPGEKCSSVSLLCDLKLLLAAEHDRLQHLVWAHMGLEVLHVPQFSDQLSKPGDQLKADVSWWSFDILVVILVQEKIPQSLHMGHSLENDIKVVIGLDVVQSNHPWCVVCSIISTGLPGACFEPPDQLLVKGGVEDVEDVVEAGVDDLVVVREAVELVGPQIEEHAVPGLQGVRVGVSVAASTLE